MTEITTISPASNLKGFMTAEAPAELISEMEWDLSGKSLKLGSRSTVTLVKIAGKSYVFKQYKTMAFHRRLRYALTRSRARQNWQNGLAFHQLGIPVVKHFAFLEETHWGIPSRSLVITHFQEGTPLDEFQNLAKVAPLLKAAFQKMAKHFVTHGDLKANNIIITPEGDPKFIDLDAGLIHRSKSHYQKARQKDEARFLQNWEDRPEALALFSGIFDQD